MFSEASRECQPRRHVAPRVARGGERAPARERVRGRCRPRHVPARATRSDATRPRGGRRVDDRRARHRRVSPVDPALGRGARTRAPMMPGRVGGRLSTAARAQVAEDDLTNDRWETVVGLELHVQLGTATKLFSAAPRRREKASGVGETTPNVAVAAFDAAWPGALPSPNRRALALAARLGVALGGVVARRTSSRPEALPLRGPAARVPDHATARTP